MVDITNKILSMLHTDRDFTDVNIAAGEPVLFRSVSGYHAIDDEIVDNEDVNAFLSMPGVAGKCWQEKMRNGAGVLELVQTMSTSRLRCSVYETNGDKHTLRIAVRRIPLVVPEMSSIGVPAHLTRMLNTGKGLFLITGPTGAGKTTTLSALLDWVNRRLPVHIQTIEQPIEYIHHRDQAVISQCEVPTNIPSFEAGIEAALRHRPDIIAIGEIRNRETVTAALRAATSGHLVIGTMHTNSCEETVNALLQFYDGKAVEQKRIMLSAALNGVISQALVPGVDGEKLVLAYELMFCNPAISLLIRQGSVHQIHNEIVAGRGEGMCTLNDSLNRLRRERKISLKAATRAAYTNDGLDM